MSISTQRLLISMAIFVFTAAGLSAHAAPIGRQAPVAALYLPLVRAADHSKIAFAATASGEIHSQIFILSQTGGPAVAIPNGCGTDAYAPTWAPGGQRLAFVTGDFPACSVSSMPMARIPCMSCKIC